VRRHLWPWLKRRGYADDEDDPTLDRWLIEKLKRRPALLRPGLRLKCHYSGGVDPATIRADITAILGAAGEPPLST
jgi:hypothetical protein